MTDWLSGLQGLQTRQENGILITLAAVRGHAPREAGAKMLVSRAESWGTVGGGNLEATLLARARAMLKTQSSTPELLTLNLTPSAVQEYGRQCCGGQVTVLLEPLRALRPSLAIFGMGHVGLALARVLNTLPWTLHLIDSRANQLVAERLQVLKGGAASLQVHHAPIPEVILPELPAGTRVLIMTHDHAEDLALCDAALRRADLPLIGLIGSAVKWTHFQQKLLEVGHSPSALSRIVTPIGLPGIGGKTPEVIALSVAAQLQMHVEQQQQTAQELAEVAGETA